jgi:cell division septation protein DedD
MKSLIKVTGLIALAGAAFFALNAGSALAAPPPPFEDEVIPHIPFDPGPELDLPALCEMTGTCDLLHPIDPCVFTDTCGVDDSAAEADDETDSGEEDMVIDPTATPTDEPTATPTDEPTATPTDEPTATPTDEPTTAPTDTPPTAQPQPGNLPPAGDNGGIMTDVGGGVVLLAGMSLGAMALAWVMLLASRKTQTQR